MTKAFAWKISGKAAGQDQKKKIVVMIRSM